jgi:hypothetical protein
MKPNTSDCLQAIIKIGNQAENISKEMVNEKPTADQTSFVNSQVAQAGS